MGAMAVALGVFVLLQVAFTRYRVGRHEVEVLWFGLVLRKITLANIESVVLGTRLPCEFWVNSGVLKGRFITIRRKRGFIRYMVITPTNPTEFRTNLYYALGWNPKA